MRKLLFVITTDENMGDLALCQEWIADLGRADFDFGYVLCQRMAPFIDPTDVQFFFDPDVHVAETILAAARVFRPDAIIFASNAFWNIRGQKGASFGVFPLKVHQAGVPLLSFDPFEIEFETRVRQTGARIRFAAVPPSVWALRYMSQSSAEPNARHFCTRSIFAGAREAKRDQVLARWGADPAKRTVVFAVSENRYAFIRRYYPEYYRHLARLFASPAAEGVQFAMISPRPIPELARSPRALSLPLIPFQDFLELIAASDLYLADSLISCIVNAFHLAVPAMLLANTEKSRALSQGSFLRDSFFPYKIFPYGFTEVCDAIEVRFGIAGCYEQVEVLDRVDFGRRLRRVLFDPEVNRDMTGRCVRWKTERLTLPTPRATVDAILAAGPLEGSESGSHAGQS
jgi:hypothetical protein